jgi:16S rRNA (guanine(966)-N(2))-methyltransferase RsmD
MRITGGSLCGRTVTCPPGIIRPAMDRMRESFFAILGPLDGLSFLDLFTGSGCIGLEAYSRGAWPVRVVEKDPGKREIILKNLGLAERRIDLSIMPAERFVKAWKEGFDLIFLDPPFDYPYKAELLGRVLESRLVRDGSRIFMHFPDEDDIPAEIRAIPVAPDAELEGRVPSADAPAPAAPEPCKDGRRLLMTRQKLYGRSVLNFYRVEMAAIPD